MKTSKIGVFGGTFDPVHLGHLQLAQQAVGSLELDQLLFVPAAQPPHKHADITPVQHRLAMLQLVCDDNSRFKCSDIECQLPKPSYTVDTLLALKKQYTAEVEMFFIIGVDAFLDFMTWKSYRTILQLVKIAVSPRVGFLENVLYKFLEDLGYKLDDTLWSASGDYQSITILPEFPAGVCSSAVRKIVAKGEVTTNLLPLDLAHYIRQNCLYNQ